MKKSLIAMIMVCIFCFASVAAAAVSPFSDVPANHWAYGAVNKLAKAGIIDGMGDGTYRGEKTLTRYEMAQIVANAMTKVDKADAENKALIGKLAREFSAELQSLGTRVTTLENNVAALKNNTSNFSYFGIFGNRYDHYDVEKVDDKSMVFVLNTYFKVNDNFQVVTQSELHRQFLQNSTQWNNNTSTDSPNGKADWQHFGLQAYADLKFNGMSAKLGRFTYIPAYGLTHGDYLEVSGALVSFGDKVKTTFVAGQDTMYVPQGTFGSMGYQAADVVFAVTPNTNIKASYQRNQTNLGVAPVAIGNDDYYNYFEGGFDTKLSKDLAFKAAYVKSNYDEANKGYFAQLTYKNAIPFVAKTYDFYVAYHNLESNSIISNDDRYYANLKGVRVGMHYAPWNSTLLTVWYDMQKYIDAGTSTRDSSIAVTSGKKDNFFRAQLDFFFK
ncbi:MAG: S-layer y domain protein [Firmicutes bacterium]|nr:S-layer y domain protein [Bacillota bacterium]